MRAKYGISFSSGQTEQRAGEYYLEAGKLDEAEQIFTKYNDLTRLGKIELLRGNYDDALSYFFRAININSEKHDPNALFAAYYGMGLTYLKEEESWKAWRAFQKAMDFGEEIRDSLSVYERERFYKDTVCGFNRADPCDSMLPLLYSSNDYELAFKYCEYQRTRMFSEPLISKYGSFKTIIPRQIRDDEIRINAKIREQRRVLGRISIKDEENIYKTARENFQWMDDERNTTIAKIRKVAPGYASLFYPEDVNYKNIHLKPNEALIEFKVCRDKTYVFLLRRGKLKMTEVKVTRNELKTLINEYMGSFDKINDYADLLKYKAKQSKKLYSLLFAKVAGGLPDDTYLIIVPDDILAIIPFDSLIYSGGSEVGDPQFCTHDKGEGQCGPFPLDVKYFCDIFNIEYAQSAVLYDLYRSVKRPVYGNGTALAVCDAILSYDDPRFSAYKTAGESQTMKMKNRAMAKWVESNMIELKKSEGTGDGVLASNLKKTCTFAYIAAQVFGKNNTTIYSELSANEKMVMDTDYSKYKYLLFDTYCFPNKTLPWIGEPAIVLNPVVDSPSNDGFLTVSNIMSMRIPSDIVLLSVNLVGPDKTANWEGVNSLGTAFQYAGAGNTIISLWPVNGEVTIQLLNAYLSQIKDGIDPVKALRRAKNHIRQLGWEHPYYWASFIMY
jgi:tetratricopeptide (TPR) repeat protein